MSKKLVWRTERRSVNSLLPYSKNPRQISDKQMGDYETAREHLKKAFEYAEDGWTKTRIENLLETIDSP